MDAPNIKLTINPELEFDTYTDQVREASVLFIKTGPSIDRWSIEWCPCHRAAMQFGSDGGARVVHGVTRLDATIIMIQTNKTPHEVFFDGQSMKWHDLAVLAPGAHFTFASKSPAQWV